MIYLATITTPANKLLSSPLKSIMKMTKGLIYKIDIYFPPGSSGLMGVAIREANVQLYPRNREEFFIGDNTTVSFPDLHMLDNEEGQLEIYTYNLDTEYDHQAQIRIGLIDRKDFQSAFVPAFSFDELTETMQKVDGLLTDIKEGTVKKGFTLFTRR